MALEGAGRGEVLAVVGMTREAKILKDAPVVIGGGCGATLAQKLEPAIHRGTVGVISFGLCGALDPSLKVGDLVIGDAVADDRDILKADPAWTARLVAALPEAKIGRFATAAAPVPDLAAKAALRERAGGAIAVDLESFFAARQARWYGLPFA